MSPDLERLAGLYGIAPFYWNNDGERQRLQEVTLRRLLVQLGVLPEVEADDDTIGVAVHRERLERWRVGLPAVAVVPVDRNSTVEIVVPESALHERYVWSVRTESGERVTGEFVSAELAESGDPHDPQGWSNAHRTRIDDRGLRRFLLPLPRLDEGYHEFGLDVSGPGITDEAAPGHYGGRRMRLIVVPRRCHEAPGDSRVWGTALQLYTLVSARNAGIGDFGDLETAIDVLATHGADLVGLNPLHALFLRDPERASPYSPSSRLFLNPLYIALDALDTEAPGSEATPAVGSEVDARRGGARGPGDSSRSRDTTGATDADASAFIDYRRVVVDKLAALDTRFERFLEHEIGADTDSARDFARFRADGGRRLELFARHEALQERYGGDIDAPIGDWHQWPEALHDPEGAAAADHAAEHPDRVTFHVWLQWLAHRQLDAAQAHAHAAGMTVGLYRDLAVGVAAGGADTWGNPGLFVEGVHVGAPPDDFSANGQDWGLPPLNPKTLAQRGFEPFVEIVRSNMRAAGALRIDHVMGLMRLFWIPAGESPMHGTYIDYPVDALLGIVALESRRARCIVIGEDLGTVPDGLRERLADAGVLSYRLLYFEKHYATDQRFRSAADYPAAALAAANSHDLPTLRAFWSGADLELRRELDLFPSETLRERLVEERHEDRRRLVKCLEREGLISGEEAARYLDESMLPDALLDAVHRFLAGTPSQLMIAGIEDLLGQLEQVNLPGTDRDLYPNWRRRLPVAVTDWHRLEALRDAAERITATRADATSG